MERPGSNTCTKNSELEISVFPLKHDLKAFDDGSIVMVTESDLVGYDATHDSGLVGNNSLAELTLACRVQVASQAAITRISCLWLRCHHWKKLLGSSLGPDQVGCIAVDISIYWGVSSRYCPWKSFPIFLGYYSNFRWWVVVIVTIFRTFILRMGLGNYFSLMQVVFFTLLGSKMCLTSKCRIQICAQSSSCRH